MHAKEEQFYEKFSLLCKKKRFLRILDWFWIGLDIYLRLGDDVSGV